MHAVAATGKLIFFKSAFVARAKLFNRCCRGSLFGTMDSLPLCVYVCVCAVLLYQLGKSVLRYVKVAVIGAGCDAICEAECIWGSRYGCFAYIRRRVAETRFRVNGFGKLRGSSI